MQNVASATRSRKSMPATRLEQLERELDPASEEYLRRVCGVLPAPAWMLEAWRRLNEEYFVGKLRAVSIDCRCRPEWSEREIGYDGAYTPMHGGRITIADQVFGHGAGAVLGILLHEMVHQYVHEAGSDEREMHGAEFRHVAGYLSRMLGVLPPAIGNEGAWPYEPIAIPTFDPSVEEQAA